MSKVVVIKVDYMLEQLVYPTVLLGKGVKICSVESISRKDPALREILRDYMSTSN